MRILSPRILAYHGWMLHSELIERNLAAHIRTSTDCGHEENVINYSLSSNTFHTHSSTTLASSKFYASDIYDLGSLLSAWGMFLRVNSSTKKEFSIYLPTSEEYGRRYRCELCNARCRTFVMYLGNEELNWKVCSFPHEISRESTGLQSKNSLFMIDIVMQTFQMTSEQKRKSNNSFEGITCDQQLKQLMSTFSLYCYPRKPTHFLVVESYDKFESEGKWRYVLEVF